MKVVHCEKWNEELFISRNKWRKIFDINFPFTVDEDSDTTLGDIYDLAQVETTKLREAESKKQKAAKCVAIDHSYSNKKENVYTRKDFDKAVGKNLILRVYNV